MSCSPFQVPGAKIAAAQSHIWDTTSKFDDFTSKRNSLKPLIFRWWGPKEIVGANLEKHFWDPLSHSHMTSATSCLFTWYESFMENVRSIVYVGTIHVSSSMNCKCHENFIHLKSNLCLGQPEGPCRLKFDSWYIEVHQEYCHKWQINQQQSGLRRRHHASTHNLRGDSGFWVPADCCSGNLFSVSQETSTEC